MSNSIIPIYEKVYLFITYRIDRTQSDRFFGAKTEKWGFYGHDVESYFNQNKALLFTQFCNSSERKNVNIQQMIIEEAFEPRDLNAKLILSRLKKNVILDLQKEEEAINSLLKGINYLNIKDRFRTFVDDIYLKYVGNDNSFKDWENIFYLEDLEANLVTCAINDYPIDTYKKEFIEYIFKRLPELFPANNYYVFIHGSSLIRDSGESCIYENPSKICEYVLCPEKFHVKSFHHTLFYQEYKFLISQESFDYLNLELLFDPKFKKCLTTIKNKIESILNAPECIHEECINKLKDVLESVKGSEKCKEIADIASFCIERLQKAAGGEDVVDVINHILEEHEILKIR